MFTKNSLLTSVCAVALVAGSPVFSEVQSTQILEEYFDVFKSTAIEIEVGDKEDNIKSSQWNNVTLKSSDGKMQIAVPWIKVSKKLSGGFALTIADQIDGAFQTPDPEVLEPVRFVVESKNMVIDIDGQLGAREYNSKFGEVTFRTLDNTIISVSATMTDGTGAHLMEADKSSGTYNLKSMKVNYRVEIEGDVVTSASTFVDIAGKFEAPYYKDYDPEIPTSAFDPSRDLFFQYSSGSGATDIFMESVVGPVEIKATFGPTSAAMGVTGSVASISGQSKDIAYDVNVAGMGLSQMQLSLSNSIVKLFVPLDNVDESKPAGAKIALSGLTLSDQVWAMFDPTAALPRDEINLDIDLSASLRWLKKIAEVDVSNTDQEPPLVMDSAEIKSLNLTIAGAELQTTGSVLVDNSQFPPVPEGTVNISLKGVQGLIGKLTEIGLIPAQNAMMIQGMTAMFFRPGEGGEDHLTSAIEMTKDGHIIANGMPIK